MGYRLRSSIDSSQEIRSENILSEGISLGLTSSQIINQLGDAGLSYRRTNMLRDIRRARAVETALTPVTHLRAEIWFDEIFEPFQKANKLAPREAVELWNKTVNESWDTLEEAEAGADIWELYRLAFQ